MGGNPTIRAVVAALTLFIAGLGAAYLYFTELRRAEYTSLEEGAVEVGEIRTFVESYFSTWSASDWAGYADHFHDDALIYSHRNGPLRRIEKDPFVEQQAAAVANSKVPMTEVAEKIIVESDGDSASVIAYWVLYRGVDTSTGVDRFTLAFDAGESRWKIVTLYWR